MSSLDEIRAVARIMEGFPHPWFVSGGWAIDLFVGRVTRMHADREIGIFRQDQQALHRHLRGWDRFKVAIRPEGGEYVPWEADEWLELPVFQLLIRPPDAGIPASDAERLPEEFEFFLNDVVDGVWRCRRNMEITRPAAESYQVSPLGIPILAPEIQLLYKAKRHHPKDEHDFQQALPLLSAAQRGWLKQMLPRCYGEDRWIAAL